MDEVILAEDFLGNCTKKRGRPFAPCHVVLTETFLDIYDSSQDRNPLLTYNVADLIGAAVEKVLPSEVTLDASTAVLMKLHFYVMASSIRGVKYRKPETVILCYDNHSTLSENETVVLKWKDCMTSLVRGESQPLSTEKRSAPLAEAKLLIFINPKSGVGTAARTFESLIAKMLQVAGVGYDVILTEYQGHAQKYITELASLDDYRGIVVVSGDGLLHEVYNGLFNRKDRETALSKPVGIVPQGSGNGLARSLAHFTGEPYLQDPILSSVLNVVKLRAVPCDLAVVSLADNTTLCSFLSIGWGLLADIDIESERLRSLGEARFTVWALARLIRLRTYKARVSYLPAAMSDVVEAVEKPPLPSLVSPVPEDWVVLEGQFVCVYCGLQPYLGTDLFFAPESQMHDGILWLLIVQAPVSKLQLSQLLLCMSNGSHVHFPWLKFVPVTAFRLEPLETTGPKAHLTVDGENITAQALQVRVLNGAGSVFMR